MTYNLFIAYDLISPGQNYNMLTDAIKSLGSWHKFQLSLFYVSTELSANDAFATLSRLIDGGDRLIIIDARGGVTTNWDNPPLDAINTIWTQG